MVEFPNSRASHAVAAPSVGFLFAQRSHIQFLHFLPPLPFVLQHVPDLWSPYARLSTSRHVHHVSLVVGLCGSELVEADAELELLVGDTWAVPLVDED
jgi:hypothetical protein